MDTIGVILAAGKGSRMGLQEKNKVTLEIEPGKSLIQKGVSTLSSVCEEILVVVGAHKESVIKDLEGYDVSYVEQKNPKGTGHAVQVATQELLDTGKTPSNVIVGYGDHMYKYTDEILQNLVNTHTTSNAAITLVTAIHEDPNLLGWGRIVKNSGGKFMKIVEQKDASEEEQKITELNAGLYCFDYTFLKRKIFNLSDNNEQKELYLTDLIEMAVEQNKVVSTVPVPFEEVGSGMNTPEHYAAEKGR